MLSAQIDSWGREVENNRKSWQPGGLSSSSSSWSWLRAAVPLLLIAAFAVAAIFSVDVDLLRGTFSFFFSHSTMKKLTSYEYIDESIDRKSYVRTVCDVTERELRSVECSKQAKCDVPHRCHKQIYYTCYYPVWHVRYKLGSQVHDATIHHEHTVYGNTQEADSVLNAVSSSKTCYADTRNPSKCQWTRPNSAPFFIFMIFTASLLGILCCCLAVDRLCNLDSPRRFVAVPSVLFSSSDDPFGNKYDADEEKRFPTSTKTNKYGSLSRAYV